MKGEKLEWHPESDFAKVVDAVRLNENPHPWEPGQNGTCRFPDGLNLCQLSEKQHTYDWVVLIKLTRDCTGSEINSWLKLLAEDERWKNAEFDSFMFMGGKYQVKKG